MEDKAGHIKKEMLSQDVFPSPFSHAAVEDGTISVSAKMQSPPASPMGPIQRTGRWTPDEKILFLYGLKRFGKGRWKKMSVYLPHRSLVQIKSHAQKVLKRLEAGENVFRRLEENYSIVDSLIVQAAKQRDSFGLSTGAKSTGAKRKRQITPATSVPFSAVQQPSSFGATTFRIQPIQPNATPSTAATATKESNPADGGQAVIAAAALCQLSSFGAAAWEQQQQQQQNQQPSPSLQEAN